MSDEAIKPADEIEAPPPAPKHVRMRHRDKEFSTSIAEKESDGSFQVPFEQLEQAQAHGLYVCHDDATHEAETTASTASATEAAAEGDDGKGDEDGKDEAGDKPRRRTPKA